MFEKNLKLAYLLDFYGDVLDEHTKSVMKAYYDDDLSLAEIAVNEEPLDPGVSYTAGVAGQIKAVRKVVGAAQTG